MRIEAGKGFVQMGDSEDKLKFEENAEDDYAIIHQTKVLLKKRKNKKKRPKS